MTIRTPMHPMGGGSEKCPYEPEQLLVDTDGSASGSITLETSGVYRFIAVGGGGYGATATTMYGVAIGAGGGSGGAGGLDILVPAGTYSWTAGGLAGDSSISFDGTIVVAGYKGGNGYASSGGGHSGGGGGGYSTAGGSIVGTVVNTVVASNGNAGSHASSHYDMPGGASVYEPWGRGCQSRRNYADGTPGHIRIQFLRKNI